MTFLCVYYGPDFCAKIILPLLPWKYKWSFYIFCLCKNIFGADTSPEKVEVCNISIYWPDTKKFAIKSVPACIFLLCWNISRASNDTIIKYVIGCILKHQLVFWIKFLTNPMTASYFLVFKNFHNFLNFLNLKFF